MQQLSWTISLGDQTNVIVLPLCVYPFLLTVSRLPSFLPWSKASSHPFLSPICKTPLDLHSLFSPPGDKTPCCLSLCAHDTGGTRPGRVGGSDTSAPKTTALFSHLNQVRRNSASSFHIPPKIHPVTTTYVLTHTQCQQRYGHIINVGVLFNILLLKLWGKLMKREHNDWWELPLQSEQHVGEKRSHQKSRNSKRAPPRVIANVLQIMLIKDNKRAY